ncbi:DnaK suppressor protein [Pseudomonas sp. TE6288]|jgi:DnaK suppressor protein|uniref:RNA polymerase-binding transcription factor DksA n=1 Tax=Pseudomonas soli TaxID=1306993 RepID=A0A1H9S5H0_9PSED|nr:MULTISPECIES: RNA polymerase-binding protein DksA [Pseudomonas]AUY35596.1 RNA polymerase-binding protein DksA [Pseudomonas sp. PONIH3]MBI6952986.1 RNA polymerase-binding protein DksA [Pseudomonas sp. CCOS 191]MDF9753572.1 DnaK suppressor protein [Pseudomonas hunanensis]MDT3715847.1 RNA polymerase-binding protein DksA [Pseudomonas soli]MDT3732500.1 RNA polymerase-binding protein DksA [Pseudomonas soli]
MSTVEKQKTSQSMYGVEPYKETKGEEYMGEPMRKHFTKLLGAWKLELMTSVDQTVTHMKDEAANFPDPADRASQEEEFALELRNRDRERKLIKKIDKTLQKIQDEEYGWCDSCGIEIGLRRLEARPTADLCFDCKEIAEKKEKTVGKG